MPAPSKQRALSCSQRRGRSAEDKPGDEIVNEETAEETASQSTPNKPKSKSPSKQAGQPTLDKHLRPVELPVRDHLEETMKGFAEKLSKLASQEYIESKFKQVVTEEFLSTKLKDLEKEVKLQIKTEIDNVYKQVKDVKDKVKVIEGTVDTLQNKVSDMETAIEKMKDANKDLSTENNRMKQQLEEREVKLKSQSIELNNIEQYTRRNSVRIYGLDDQTPNETSIETARQVVKLVNEKLSSASQHQILI